MDPTGDPLKQLAINCFAQFINKKGFIHHYSKIRMQLIGLQGRVASSMRNGFYNIGSHPVPLVKVPVDWKKDVSIEIGNRKGRDLSDVD